MKLLDKFLKKQPYTSRIIFDVRGPQYYLDGYDKLRKYNPLWDSTSKLVIECYKAMDKIPEFYYENYPVKLVPEPKNEHDPNAIKVLVNGKMIGYVPAELCLDVKQILHDNPKYGLSAWIQGGKYKIVSENGVAEIFEEDISAKIYLYY